MLRKWLEQPAEIAVFTEELGAWGETPALPTDDRSRRSRGSWLDAVAGLVAESENAAGEAILSLKADDNGLYGLFRDVHVRED